MYIEYIVARNRSLVKRNPMYERYFSPVTIWYFRKFKEPPFSKSCLVPCSFSTSNSQGLWHMLVRPVGFCGDWVVRSAELIWTSFLLTAVDECSIGAAHRACLRVFGKPSVQLFPAPAVSSYWDAGNEPLTTQLQLTFQATLHFLEVSSQFFGALDASTWHSRVWTVICSGLEAQRIKVWWLQLCSSGNTSQCSLWLLCLERPIMETNRTSVGKGLGICLVLFLNSTCLAKITHAACGRQNYKMIGRISGF